MSNLRTVEDLDLTAPDRYVDLQIWLKRNFEIIQQRMLAPEVCLSAYDAIPARASVTNLHGGLTLIDSASVLNPTTPLVVDNGLSKILFMPQVLVDGIGTATITGTKVDRSTGVETAGFSETVTIAWTTAAVDSSTTDANGNPVHHLHDGFMTAEWYKGTVTITTTDLSFTNIDSYSIGFEQLNDSPFNELDTLDVNLFVTNVAAEFDAHLCTVIVDPVTGRTTIHTATSLALGTPPEADRYYRLRDSSLAVVLDGSSDGFFCQLYYSNSPAYIEDVTSKVWLNNPTG